MLTINAEELRKYIISVDNFPKEGISFKDITPLLADSLAFNSTIDMMSHKWFDLHKKVDIIIGIESRGFLFASPIADRLGIGLVLARKPGKLPRKTVSASYDYEYAKSTLEIHADSISSGQNVLIIDDVLATGSTVNAVTKMVNSLGGNVVGNLFLIELEALNGRQLLSGNVVSLLKY